jgi:hypothetical protein
MAHHTRAVAEWEGEVGAHLPHLSGPQRTVLALWCVGLVLARSCALSAVAGFLAVLEGRKENTVRQQLREFCYEADAKAGPQRQAVVVEPCFGPLLRWVLERYAGRQVALALDATTLGERFVVLAVSVVYRGGAIPVAWTVLRAGDAGAWRKEWLRLLRQVRPGLPATIKTVIVLADRGLYARWLFGRIVRLGWHPFLRINLGGKFRPAGCRDFQPLCSFAPQPGATWSGRGVAFATKPCRLSCTLLVTWEAGCKDPWLILTDLPPEAADAGWYGLRAWIEQGFKITKRAGWQWQRTKMTDPDRAARLWLAVAVATLWLLRVGGEADANLPDATLPDLAPALAADQTLRQQAHRRQRQATRLRLVSIFRRGWILIVVALLKQEPLPTGAFRPEPWPARPTAPLPRPGLDDAA